MRHQRTTSACFFPSIVSHELIDEREISSVVSPPNEPLSLDLSFDLLPTFQLTHSHVGSDGENFKVIISNANMQTLENGSLYVREVGREDAGHYMVQAINGVGPGISLVVRLTVNGRHPLSPP